MPIWRCASENKALAADLNERFPLDSSRAPYGVLELNAANAYMLGRKIPPNCASGQKISAEARAALSEEVKSHNEFARQLFSIFAPWWAFVCTANVSVIVAIIAANKDKMPVLHLLAPIVAVLDLLGSGFCLLIAMRLARIIRKRRNKTASGGV